MIYALFMLLAEPAQLVVPVIFTAEQQRDITCVAVLAMASAAQKRGDQMLELPADLPLNGKRWTVMVGQRVMEQTGAPKELVAIAMTEAAKAEQAALQSATDPKALVAERVNGCLPIMQTDLLANAPLPKPQLAKPQSSAKK
jgi:hypothetical protein